MHKMVSKRFKPILLYIIKSTTAQNANDVDFQLTLII